MLDEPMPCWANISLLDSPFIAERSCRQIRPELIPPFHSIIRSVGKS
jgi:hypothetical protein